MAKKKKNTEIGFYTIVKKKIYFKKAGEQSKIVRDTNKACCIVSQYFGLVIY